MVRIAVLGGSRGCARAMVVQGLDKYQFKLLVRNPDNIEYDEQQKSKLTLIKGDAMDPVAVRQLLEDIDVVVSSIGSTIDIKTGKMAIPNLCSKSMKVLLEVIGQMEKNRPQRLVVVSSTGLDDSSDVPCLFRPMYKYLLHEPHEDKREMEKMVINQNVIPDWILARPSFLKNGKVTGKYRAGENLCGYLVNREDVGHFLLNQCIEQDEFLQKKVVVTN
ncbi:hypothetical protein EDC96DRAFT_571661 [Choanephora cucurbitarum]|nr:hypothetical protein EDC96DRAFT_571661 [Choanephora cucurbitarum]